MSWLAKSLVNSLKISDEDDEEDQINSRNKEQPEQRQEDQNQIESLEETQGRGSVKEDLSELTKTLTRQLWGVASFLAPPPSEPSLRSSPHQISSTDPSISDWNRSDSYHQSVSEETPDLEVSDSARIAGIRSDFAEIGGKFKTGISKLSNHKAVTEISKIASTFLPFGLDEEDYDEKHLVGGAIGVTDEVLTFARNIAMHPETWLDFPLADDEEWEDFDISDAQQEHALAVERLAPRLAALRIELCPGHMSEGCFWKIYFVLLHPRLNKHDAELLSTPQIVEARAMLMQELQKRTKPEPELSGRSASYSKDFTNSSHEEHLFATPNIPTETTLAAKTFTCEGTDSIAATDFETEKCPVVNTELQIIDKSVVEEKPIIHEKNKDLLVGVSKVLEQKYEDDGDDWLEETSEMDGFSGMTVPLGNEEDVSFSDLEDDDDGDVSMISKTAAYSSDSYSTKDSQGESAKKDGHPVDTRHLGSELSHSNKPETKESSDWLNIDEIDVV